MMSEMYRWRYLLVDLDETLLDFRQSERTALIETLQQMGLTGSEEEVNAYHQANDRLWKMLERGEVSLNTLRWQRFHDFLSQMGLDTAMAPGMSDTYIRHFAKRGQVLPGAMDFLRILHPRMLICVLTNGITAIQRGRIAASGIAPYVDHLVVADEEGVSKPDPAIFHIALKRCGCKDKSQAVMLGDSLTSDIEGANRAGIASIHLCWGAPGAQGATFQVTSLQEAADLLSKYCVSSATRPI